MNSTSDLWIMLWSLESDQICSDPTEICSQDVWHPGAWHVCLQHANGYMLFNYSCWWSHYGIYWNLTKCYFILTVNRSAFFPPSSRRFSVPNKYSCYWHIAVCYNRKFLPENAFKRTWNKLGLMWGRQRGDKLKIKGEKYKKEDLLL